MCPWMFWLKRAGSRHYQGACDLLIIILGRLLIVPLNFQFQDFFFQFQFPYFILPPLLCPFKCIWLKKIEA